MKKNETKKKHTHTNLGPQQQHRNTNKMHLMCVLHALKMAAVIRLQTPEFRLSGAQHTISNIIFSVLFSTLYATSCKLIEFVRTNAAATASELHTHISMSKRDINETEKENHGIAQHIIFTAA